MRPAFLLLVSVVALLLFPELGIAGYSFVVSASDTDPSLLETPPQNGPRVLYLWLLCGDDPLSALEAQVTGTLAVLGFQTLNGAINAGSATHLLLAIGSCPSDSTVLGSWTVWDGGGDFCLGPPLVAVDCATPSPSSVPMPQVTGFSSTGTPPCDIGAYPCESLGQSLVIGYGVVLDPPFAFSGIGADTLSLNGLAYYPTPQLEGDPVTVPPEISKFTADTDTLRQAAFAAVAGLPDSTAVLNTMADVYGQSPLVDTVIPRHDIGKLEVTWVFAPFQGIPWFIGPQDLVRAGARPPPVLREDQTSLHQTLVEQFELIVERGGYVAFGTDYFITCGSQAATRSTRRALRALADGDRVDLATTDRTPLVNPAACREIRLQNWGRLGRTPVDSGGQQGIR